MSNVKCAKRKGPCFGTTPTEDEANKIQNPDNYVYFEAHKCYRVHRVWEQMTYNIESTYKDGWAASESNDDNQNQMWINTNLNPQYMETRHLI